MMKKKLEELYINAINEDLAPNVFVDKILNLFSIKEYCKCDEPNREPGFSYCHRCRSDVSNKRMDELTEEEI